MGFSVKAVLQRCPGAIVPVEHHSVPARLLDPIVIRATIVACEHQSGSASTDLNFPFTYRFFPGLSGKRSCRHS